MAFSPPKKTNIQAAKETGTTHCRSVRVSFSCSVTLTQGANSYSVRHTLTHTHTYRTDCLAYTGPNAYSFQASRLQTALSLTYMNTYTQAYDTQTHAHSELTCEEQLSEFDKKSVGSETWTAPLRRHR